MWSWDITYLPPRAGSVQFHLYLGIDVWTRKVGVWDFGEREDPAIMADLVGRACVRDRINKGRHYPLILNADNCKV